MGELPGEIAGIIWEAYIEHNKEAEGPDLGHATEFIFVNDTDMTLDLIECNDDHCEWSWRYGGGAEQDGKPDAVMNPRAKCTGTATTHFTQFSQDGTVRYQSRDGSNSTVWKIWFNNPLTSPCEVHCWVEGGPDGKYSTSWRVRDGPSRNDVYVDVLITDKK